MPLNPATDRDQLLSFAVARLIAEKRGGGDVRIQSCPEKEERTLPAVELITADALGELAIEHTTIEPFDEEIQDQARTAPYARRLPELLTGRFPNGSRFDLVVHPLATKGVKPAQIERIASSVEGVASTLLDGRPNTAPRHMAEAGPPELPFAVTLARWPQAPHSPLPSFTVGSWKPSDLEHRRVDRLERALAKKTPKLMEAAGEGRQAVLVLESRDIQLSKAWDIASALRAAANRFGQSLPDWIVLLETMTKQVSAWVLRLDGSWLNDISRVTLPLGHTQYT